MRQNPTDVPENQEIADYLHELFHAFGSALKNIFEARPYEFNRGSTRIASILDAAELDLARNRRGFEDRMTMALIHDRAVLNEIKELKDFIAVLNDNLRPAAWNALTTYVPEKLQRLNDELHSWRIMGCANNHTHFSGIQAPDEAQHQRTTLRLVELEES